MVNIFNYFEQSEVIIFTSVSFLFPNIGRNISSKIWLHDLSFNEDYIISPMIFKFTTLGSTHLQWKKNCYKIISLSTRQTLFLYNSDLTCS